MENGLLIEDRLTDGIKKVTRKKKSTSWKSKIQCFDRNGNIYITKEIQDQLPDFKSFTLLVESRKDKILVTPMLGKFKPPKLVSNLQIQHLKSNGNIYICKEIRKLYRDCIFWIEMKDRKIILEVIKELSGGD